MTHERDLERLLDAWFADGPAVVADRVIDGLEARIVRQPQRPAWRLQPWRVPPVTSAFKLAMTAVVAVAIAIGAFVALRPTRSDGPGSVPTPTASHSAPSPGASAVTSSIPTPSASYLSLQPGASSQSPGTYRTGVEAGWVTYVLPPGWTSPLVGPLDFVLHRDAGPAEDDVRVFFDMRRAAKDAACTEAPEPGVGTTAQALVDDIAADPSLAVKGRSAVTTQGLTGFALDVELAKGVTKTCPFQPELPGVAVIVDDVGGEGPFWGVSRGERVRFIVLDAPGRHNVVVVVDSVRGASFEALVAAVMPLVDTLTFEPR